MNFEKTFRQFQKKWRQGKYRQQVQKISIGTGAVCAVLLIAYFMQGNQEEQAIETLRQIRDEASAESGNPDLVLGDQQILAQYQELFMQNPDLIGWLTIDGTRPSTAPALTIRSCGRRRIRSITATEGLTKRTAIMVCCLWMSFPAWMNSAET